MTRFSLVCIGFLMSLSANSQSSYPHNKLALCPNSPNCVSSQASDSDHFVAPFKIKGDANKAWAVFRQVLTVQNRTVITETGEESLHAEATSLIFRFVDDIQAILDADAGLIHIRSASRVGYSDLGVNRKRVESIRQQLQQAGVVE